LCIFFVVRIDILQKFKQEKHRKFWLGFCLFFSILLLTLLSELTPIKFWTWWARAAIQINETVKVGASSAVVTYNYLFQQDVSVDSDGIVHVVFFDKNHIICGSDGTGHAMRDNNGVWTGDCVGTGSSSSEFGVGSTFLNLNGQQTIYASYGSAVVANRYVYVYKKRKTSLQKWSDVSWSSVAVFTMPSSYPPGGVRMAVTPDGRLAVIYSVGGVGYIKYDSNGDGVLNGSNSFWITSAFMTGLELKYKPGSNTIFGMVAGDYQNAYDPVVYYEFNIANNTWTVSQALGENGVDPGLDYNASNYPVVSYANGTKPRLAVFNGSTWSYSDIYTSGLYGTGVAIGNNTTSTIWGGGYRIMTNGSWEAKQTPSYALGVYTLASDKYNNYLYAVGNNGANTINFLTDDPNTAPTFASLSVTSSKDGTGYITVNGVADDPENDEVKLKVEYKSGTCAAYSGTATTTLSSTVLATYGAANITVSNSDSNAYQLQNVTTTPGANTVTTTWTSKTNSTTADGTFCVFVTPHDGAKMGTTVSTTVVLDNVNPTAPGALTTSTVSTSTAILTYGAASVDTNFSRYRIYYSTSSPVSESGTEHSDVNLTSRTFNGAATTTLTGLSPNTTYYVNIWAYDTYSNQVSSTELTFATAVFNQEPTLTEINPAQSGTSAVIVTTTIADPNSDATNIYIQYTTNSINWVSTTLSGVTASEGSPVYSTPGQITGIAATTSVNLIIYWNIATDLPNTDSSAIYLRLTPNDGSLDGTTVTSSAFIVDTQSPTVPGNLSVNTTSISSVILNFAATSTDSHFSQYKIFYKAGASGVTESDLPFTSSSDANLGVATFNDATTTTISDLATSTQYVVNLWAYDVYGNKSNAVTELAFYTLAATSSAPTVTASSTSAYQVIINPVNDTASTNYYICKTIDAGVSCDTNGYVQADGTLGASAVWQSYATWGGASGITVTGFAANTPTVFITKARNGSNIETGFSPASTAAYTFTDQVADVVLADASVTNTLQIQLSWTDVGQTGLKIEQDNACDDTYVTIYDNISGFPASPLVTSTNITPNVCYQFRFSSYNAAGVVNTVSRPVSNQITSPPAQPQNLSVSSATTDSITWNWDAVTDAVNYFLYDNLTGSLIDTIVGALEYLQSSLSSNTSYSVFLRANNTNGTGIASDVATGYTNASAPTNVQASSKTQTSIRWSWDYINQTAFWAQNKSNPAENSGWITDTTTLFWDQTGLTANTTTTVQVKAKDVLDVETGFTEAVAYTLQNNIDSLSFSSIASDSITVTANGTFFNQNVGSSHFHFDNGSGQSIDDGTTWANSGLEPNTQYTFTATPYNGNNEASSSTVGAKYTLANTPGQIVSTVVTDSNSLSLALSANSNPASTNVLLYSPTTDQYVDKTAKTLTGTISSFDTLTNWTNTVVVTGLATNTAYQFQAVAKNGDDILTATSTASVAVYTRTSIPAGVAATVDGTTQITLNWTGDGTEYYAENVTAGTNSGWVSGVTWVSDSLTANTQYIFRVKARNVSSVETDWSEAVLATTDGGTPDVVTTGGGGGPGLDGTIQINQGMLSTTNTVVNILLTSLYAKYYDLAETTYEPVFGTFGPCNVAEMRTSFSIMANPTFTISTSTGWKGICVKYKDEGGSTIEKFARIEYKPLQTCSSYPPDFLNYYDIDGRELKLDGSDTLRLISNFSGYSRVKSVWGACPFERQNPLYVSDQPFTSTSTGKQMVSYYFPANADLTPLNGAFPTDILHNWIKTALGIIPSKVYFRQAYVTGGVVTYGNEISFDLKIITLKEFCDSTNPDLYSPDSNFYSFFYPALLYSKSCSNSLDTDKDGVPDGVDNCPTTLNPDQLDTNNNGVGDVCDRSMLDMDGDGVADDIDNCIATPNTDQKNLDNDTYGDACDICALDPLNDIDLDGICGNVDNCKNQKNRDQEDVDKDGVGDVCDNCANISNADQKDLNKNGVGDACEDSDKDGKDDSKDNCPLISNSNQTDSDNDSVGDVCDNCPNKSNKDQKDTDKDKVGDACDNCLNIPNANQLDTNKNGVGDMCELLPDQDQDGIPDTKDNCVNIKNTDQKDSDNDGAGDVCDICSRDRLNDFDKDGVCGDVDNCPNTPNPDQTPSSRSSVLGAACDHIVDTDGDNIPDQVDNCPLIPNPLQQDTDLDKIGDVCDACPIDAYNRCKIIVVSSTTPPGATSTPFVEQITNIVSTTIRVVAVMSEQITEKFNIATLFIEDVVSKYSEEVKAIIDNPQVEKITKTYVAPAIVIAGAANISVGLQLADVLAVLRSLFLQPLLFFRLRKKKKWGIVYDSFTKQALTLATIRVMDAVSGKIVRTQVTDSLGRYLLILDPGTYKIVVEKSGYSDFSEHLRGQEEDSKYLNLYHGQAVTVTEKQNIIYNIPVDPVAGEESFMVLLKQRALIAFKYTLSFAGLIISGVSLIITPTALVFGFFFAQLLFFGITRKFAFAPMPIKIGQVLDADISTPIGQAIVRVFDATYNKLVNTTLSNTKGQYAVLVGPSKYYVTYEKPGFNKLQTDILNYSSEKTKGEGGIISLDQKLKRAD